MKAGNAGYRGPIGGDGGTGPVGGDGGTGPVGGDGGTGPVGGGGASQKIFQEVANKLEELSGLFDDLAGTPLGGAGGGLAGGAVDFNPQILFIEERQQGCELCWIAVAVSVKRHFDSTSGIRQCELVKTILNIPGACCNDSGVISKECDKPGMLEEALSDPSVNHLAAAIPPDQNPKGPNGALTFAQVKSQIDNNLPVCFYIQWPDHQVGHFSVISGYNESGGEEYVYVNDPIFGSGPQPFNRVVSNYNLEQGNWQYTYRLKA